MDKTRGRGNGRETASSKAYFVEVILGFGLDPSDIFEGQADPVVQGTEQLAVHLQQQSSLGLNVGRGRKGHKKSS
jgi:hypothetical protein